MPDESSFVLRFQLPLHHFVVTVTNYVISEYLYLLYSLRTKTSWSERYYWTRLDWHETSLSHKMSVPLGTTAANIQFSYDRTAQTLHNTFRVGFSVIARRPSLSHTRAAANRRPTVTYRTGSVADGISCFRVTATAFVVFLRTAHIMMFLRFWIRKHVYSSTIFPRFPRTFDTHKCYLLFLLLLF